MSGEVNIWEEIGMKMENYLKIKNTFLDFIYPAKYLIKKIIHLVQTFMQWEAQQVDYLMGAVINMEPELFNGVIAAVPFVDVMTTMLDNHSINNIEYDIGNPNDLNFINIC